MSNKISNDKIAIDISSNKTFCIGTYVVLCVVASAMTALNIVTDKGFLTMCTGAFAVLCIVNVLLSLLGRVGASVAKGLFAIEVLCMFTFFLVSGNPDGFSAIWICMLPSLGMFFFNRYRGTALCVAMFLILVLYLWLPYGQDLLADYGYTGYQYSDTFKMRFPVLFVAFHMLAFLLETLRFNAYKEMRKMQDYYHDLSERDPLTRVYNRQGMYSELNSRCPLEKCPEISAVMFDIDDFKSVNDRFGHDMGDVVLKSFAEIIESNFNAIVCRWGGEEFVALFVDGAVDPDTLENVRMLIEAREYSGSVGRFSITASIGVCTATDFIIRDIDSLISKADSVLYKAKNSGKNQIVYYDGLQSDDE